MSWRIDPLTDDIVISGFEQGIGASPYAGISDLKSVNVSTIPGEASVSFKTSSVSLAPSLTNQAGTVATPSNLFSVPPSFKMESYQWITFSNIATGGTGLSTGTPYLLLYQDSSGGTDNFTLKTSLSGSPLTISANSAVTFSTIDMGLPKYGYTSNNKNFVVDANGRAWSDINLTGTNGAEPHTTDSWSYLGNLVGTSSTLGNNGNGVVVYKTVANATGGGTSTPATYDEWLFIFRNSAIDYAKITAANVAQTPSWVYNWNPATGTTASLTYLQTPAGTNNPHMSIVVPTTSQVNYCDANCIGNFYQNLPSAGSTYTGFDPLNTATYTFSVFTAILPPSEVAQCLTYLGSNLLIGGNKNVVYPWDMQPGHNTYSPPAILLPETNVANLVTVGNKAYIFAGNRGNIYVTNGSQADFFKKVPDHISGVPEPLFTWYGATYAKNRLYFSCLATPQQGTDIGGYGGIWCVDLTTNAIYLAQQLSYGTYNGYAPVIMVPSQSTAGGFTYSINTGFGILAAWNNGSATYGIDIPRSIIYSGGESSATSDMIPLGTTLKPSTPSQLEFKLSTPLLVGETIQLQAGTTPTGTFTSVLTTNGDGNLVAANSEKFPLQELQWLCIKAILTGSTSPTALSYNRLTEIRIIDGGKLLG